MSATIGGNSHENWTLLRLLLLLIGDIVPEDDDAWSVILELKVIVELLASSSFTDESLCYLDAKISEHGKLLLIVFPGLKLKPKHHFLEHYAHLMRCFGPLVDFWTLRFEAKHSFFKKVVHSIDYVPQTQAYVGILPGHAQPVQTNSGRKRSIKCFPGHCGLLCQASD